MGADEPSRTVRWDGQSYAQQSDHHRAMDDWFLQRHPPRPGDVVIDAGCGSGEFTARLAALVPDGRVIGVDPDPSMLAAAREHTSATLEFRQGRLQDLDQICSPGSADLVVSRAVFHWIPLADYLRCYAAIHRVLKPGGWLHAESGAAGNVARVVEVFDDIAARHGLAPVAPSFPDPGTVLGLVEQAGFDVPAGGVLTVAQRRPFDAEQLRGFLRTQAAIPYVSRAPAAVREAFLADVDRRREELRRHDGTFDQTFVRLDVLCRRPD